ncbi:MFS transporter [Telluribacter humicola]|uniref:MFS transporter n=1 Tax=Telluribacter humicola TaxID=1720261 RepID=UPI001A97B1EF|nr:MFS transporter [Telluribacter humicola]
MYLTKKQIAIMAVTAGIAVANVYYSQPILTAIAYTYHIAPEKAGVISVLSQIGYGLGLFFLTPVGDMIERKKLILYLQAGLIASLLIMALATNLWLLYASSFLIGVFSVVAQVILPMAASLVTENKGKVVSLIFTGILVGILMARVFSGLVAGWLGWQYVYGISAGLVLCTAILMQTDFRAVPNRFNGNYPDLLKSTITQLGRFPLLRRTALTGMLAFGTFSAFWVVLTFHLSGPDFRYSASQIGLFGLLAAASALIAPLFGKLADKGSSFRSLLFSTGITLFSILLLKQFDQSVAAIWVAVILLDIGVQATQVTNIAVIYTLDHTANSRINTVYMTSYIIGGALGAYAAILCYEWGGWQLATTLMGTLGVLAAVNVVLAKRHYALKVAV